MRLFPSRLLAGTSRAGVALRPLFDGVASLAAAALPAPTPAVAPVASFYGTGGSLATKTITFEGLSNTQAVLDYYAGNGGPQFGVTFPSNVIALKDSDVPGGTGNFANEPSPDTVMFFQTGTSAILNSPGGFTTAISFWYTTRLTGGIAEVFSEVDAGGSLLGSVELAALGTNGPGDPTGAFVNWEQAGIGFAGLGKSLRLAGDSNFIAFDDITFLSAQPAQPVVLTGVAPYTVNFHDTSINSPTGWDWAFGDGGTSTLQNPQHTYNAPGIYPVSLTASNGAGSDSEVRAAYVVVMAP